MTYLDFLQYTGSTLAVLGACYVSSSWQSRRQTGFMLWTCSNILLLGWAGRQSLWGLVAMYAIFLVTCIKGWFTNNPRALCFFGWHDWDGYVELNDLYQHTYPSPKCRRCHRWHHKDLFNTPNMHKDPYEDSTHAPHH